MDTFFYIHYNGIIPQENHTLFEMFILYFSDVLSFKTQDTDSGVFDKTLDYLRNTRQSKDENFCGSEQRGVPGMRLGYLKQIMREKNKATLISYGIEEGQIIPRAILVFKNGYPTAEDNPNLYLDGMCSDQLRPIKGMGSQLLSIFIGAAKNVGFEFIELASASKQATVTWKKKGFERDLQKRLDHDKLPIYSLNLQEVKKRKTDYDDELTPEVKKLKGGEGNSRVMIDLKHNNDILVCDETCNNLGPLPSGQLNSLDDINNYINEQIEIKKEGGKKQKKHKTRKHRTRKHRTRKYKRK